MHPSKPFRFGRSLLTLATAVTLLLMYGDQSSEAGIQGSGRARMASVGRITGLDRLVVNGIPYGIGVAQIRINGSPAPDSALRIGDIVLVRGTLDPSGTSAEATHVIFEADLVGAVTAVDAATGTFNVLRQTVRVTDETLFDESIQPASLAGVQPGVLVQVSGFANAAGEIIASRIDAGLGSSARQIRGTVTNLDPSARTFRINNLTVDYSAVAPAGAFATGAPVIVRGSDVSSTGVLLATSVKAPGKIGATDERGSVEGIVTRYTSRESFEISGQRITTDSRTHFIPRKAVPGPDSAVEVQGLFDHAGVLHASRVKVKSKAK